MNLNTLDGIEETVRNSIGSENTVKELGDEDEQALSNINKTSLMIAYERYLESKNETPLFIDPYAETLAGKAGKQFSEEMAANSNLMGFGEWKDFHRTWTVIRTCFIDSWITKTCNNLDNEQVFQFVNLGAGVDTRTFRLDCLKEQKCISWEVDLPKVNELKESIFKKLELKSYCERYSVDSDLSKDTLEDDLKKYNFDPAKPSFWLLEGLLMYLPLPLQSELLKKISSLSASSSVAVINFAQCDYEGYADKYMDDVLLKSNLNEDLWDITIHRYGDDTLNYGRFPEGQNTAKLFSFAVCRRK